MKKVIFFLPVLLLLFTSCRKCKDAPQTNYVFELPITLSPKKDTFKIGDTIHISSVFGTEHIEVNEGTRHKFEDFDYHFGMYASKIDSFYPPSDDGIFPSLRDFTIILDSLNSDNRIVNFSDGDKSVRGTYNFIDSKYNFNIKLIPQKKGLYFLKHGIDGDDYEKQDFEGRCKNTGLRTNMIMNGREDSNNSEYLYESPTEHFNAWIPQKLNSRFHDLSGYCFYVTE